MRSGCAGLLAAWQAALRVQAVTALLRGPSPSCLLACAAPPPPPPLLPRLCPLLHCRPPTLPCTLSTPPAAAPQMAAKAERLKREQLRSEVLDVARAERRARLLRQSAGWVTPQTLDARIKEALDNPVPLHADG